MPKAGFSKDVLRLDPEKEAEKICASMRKTVFGDFKRKGAVLGVSGGVDSAVVAALCARALGPDRVLGLFLPERDCSADSLELGKRVTDHLGIEARLEDVDGILDAAGCYRRRDEAIRELIPEYGSDYKCKIVMPGPTGAPGYALFSVVVESPDGKQTKARPTAEALRAIVAATNFKQRTRKMLEYYHADRRHYCVAGTPNRLEYDQGFFVKNGDGAADLKPIAHLYKTQVYELAEFLELPGEIRQRVPTTDTYSLEQSQEEFYFGLPYETFDLCLYAVDHGISAEDAAGVCDLTSAQAARVFQDIEAKRRMARYLHAAPVFVEPVSG